MNNPFSAADSAKERVDNHQSLRTGEVLLPGKPVVQQEDVSVSFAERAGVRGAAFDIHETQVTALIGPSSSGTTLQRALNGIHDEVPRAPVTGKVLMGELKDRVTIMIVTHHPQQTAEVSDPCASLFMADDKCSESIEYDATAKPFNDPTNPRALECVNGHSG
jgi:ABC-type phosphate transport system ATPase subunit